MTSPIVLAALKSGPRSAADIAKQTGLKHANTIQTLRYLETTRKVKRLLVSKPVDGQRLLWHLPGWAPPARFEPATPTDDYLGAAKYSNRGAVP